MSSQQFTTKEVALNALFCEYCKAYPAKKRELAQKEVHAEWALIRDTGDWDTRAQTLLNTYKAAQLRKQGALMNFWSRQVVCTPSQQQ